MKNASELKELLYKIDHRGYPAYKDTKGCYQFAHFILYIEHVQGDPFAAPSKLKVEVPGRTAGFPARLYDRKHKRVSLQDHILRQFYAQAEKYSFKARGSGKSGIISVSRPGQEILERTACEIEEETGKVCIRLEAGFPANGRTINAGELIRMLFDFLPKCVESAMFYKSLDTDQVEKVMELSEDREYIKGQLKEFGLVAFIADGSILPRESGVSSRPMKQATAFYSPESMKVKMNLPYYGEIEGMGIQKGVTLIVGGGYHGKSTLLKALEMGVYPHIAGDGREYVVTDEAALKIRAEDGRSIKHTDISMFINDLPNGKDTKAFATEDASGSTSQAANVIEGMEAGAKTFLIDEDTSATNFMIRDELMQRVVNREAEPITPFIERIRALYEVYGISTVIVAGSSGSYFHVADCVLQMERYKPREITAFARNEAKAFPMLKGPDREPAKPDFRRCPGKNTALSKNKRVKMKTMGRDGISLNRETIDLRYVEQLADSEQLTCLLYMVQYAEDSLFDRKITLAEAVDRVYSLIETEGMKALFRTGSVPGNLAMPRKQELFACLNRYRGLKL